MSDTTTQPEALRIAEILDTDIGGGVPRQTISAELRRQQAEIERLKLALLSADEGTKDREHAEKYFKQAEQMLTANERTLMEELATAQADLARVRQELICALEREKVAKESQENLVEVARLVSLAADEGDDAAQGTHYVDRTGVIRCKGSFLSTIEMARAAINRLKGGAV